MQQQPRTGQQWKLHKYRLGMPNKTNPPIKSQPEAARSNINDPSNLSSECCESQVNPDATETHPRGLRAAARRADVSSTLRKTQPEDAE